MRRSSRSIETFDISLMAVVTKAMGAFLVLMLLLMPYYSSGPIGQQQAADLASQIEQINQKINEVMNRLTNASPEDLRKLLEEALRRLEEARRLLMELKRANDALQAQARRLEQQVAQLQDEVKKLNDELNKFKGYSITATMSHFDCKDRMSIDVYRDTVYTLPDKTQSKYGLNFPSTSVSGEGENFSHTIATGLVPATYYPVVKIAKEGGALENMRGGMGRRLKRSTANCYLYAGLVAQLANGSIYTFPLSKFEIKQGQYAVSLGALVIGEKDAPWTQTSAAATTWLTDQLNNAVKDD